MVEGNPPLHLCCWGGNPAPVEAQLNQLQLEEPAEREVCNKSLGLK